jgi:hypothetical protein
VLQVICVIDTFLFCILAIWIPQAVMVALGS